MSDLTFILYDAELEAEKARGDGFRQASERDRDSLGGGMHRIDTRKATAPAERVEAARRGGI